MLSDHLQRRVYQCRDLPIAATAASVPLTSAPRPPTPFGTTSFAAKSML